jgi:hypothetical protein
MSMVNNDPNWRAPAAADLAENTPVYLNAGIATAANPDAKATCAVGIVPQAIKSGDRAPVIRQGKIGGLTGFSAGATLYLAADGTIDDAPAANPHYTQRLGRVSAEDATVAFIDIEDPDVCAVTPT